MLTVDNREMARETEHTKKNLVYLCMDQNKLNVSNNVCYRELVVFGSSYDFDMWMDHVN